eukprot:gene25460-11119_t
MASLAVLPICLLALLLGSAHALLLPPSSQLRKEELIPLACAGVPAGLTVCHPYGEDMYIHCKADNPKVKSCSNGASRMRCPAPDEFTIGVGGVSPPLGPGFGQQANFEIELNETGSTKYFCPVIGHCVAGMYFEVTVLPLPAPTGRESPCITEVAFTETDARSRGCLYGDSREVARLPLRRQSRGRKSPCITEVAFTETVPFYETLGNSDLYPTQLPDVTAYVGDKLHIMWRQPTHILTSFDDHTEGAGVVIPYAPQPNQPSNANQPNHFPHFNNNAAGTGVFDNRTEGAGVVIPYAPQPNQPNVPNQSYHFSQFNNHVEGTGVFDNHAEGTGVFDDHIGGASVVIPYAPQPPLPNTTNPAIPTNPASFPSSTTMLKAWFDNHAEGAGMFDNHAEGTGMVITYPSQPNHIPQFDNHSEGADMFNNHAEGAGMVTPYPPQPIYKCPDWSEEAGDNGAIIIPLQPGETRLLEVAPYDMDFNVTVDMSHDGAIFACPLSPHCRMGQVFKVSLIEAVYFLKHGSKIEAAYFLKRGSKIEATYFLKHGSKIEAVYFLKHGSKIEATYFLKHGSKIEAVYFLKHGSKIEAVYFLKHGSKNEAAYFLKHGSKIEAVYFLKHGSKIEATYFLKHGSKIEATYFLKHGSKIEAVYFLKHGSKIEAVYFLKHGSKIEAVYFLKHGSKIEAVYFLKHGSKIEAVYFLKHESKIEATYFLKHGSTFEATYFLKHGSKIEATYFLKHGSKIEAAI